MIIDIDDFNKISSGGATKLSELQIDTDLDMGDYNILTEGEYYGNLNEGISIRIQNQNVSMMNNSHTQFNTDLYSTTGGPISIQDLIIDGDLNMGNYDISLNGGDISTKSGMISGILDQNIKIGDHYTSVSLMDSSNQKINPDLYDSSGGLPSGLEFEDNILYIGNDSSKGGLVIPGLMAITNKTKEVEDWGTSGDMVLLKENAQYYAQKTEE